MPQPAVHHPLRPSIYLSATFVLYFAAQVASLVLGQRSGGNAGLWPASAVGLVFILGAPDHRRRLVALVTVGANLAAHLIVGPHTLSALLVGLGVRLLGDWGGAVTVARVLGVRPALNRSQPLLTFAALVGLVITPIVAIVGAIGLAASGGPPFLVGVVQWYVPEVVMTLMLAPALWVSLQWVSQQHQSWHEAAMRGLERAVLLGALAGAVALVAMQPSTWVISLPISIAAVPLMIIIAYRYGVGTTAWAGIVMFSTLLLVTANGIGPFASTRAPGFSRYVAIELYAGVLAISLVLLAAVLRDLRASSDRLQSFLNTTDSPIIAVDSGRRIVGFSPNAAQMFLRLANHVLKRGQDPLGPMQGTSDTMARRAAAWTSALTGQPSVAFLEPNPETRFEMRYEPMFSGDGQVVGAVATATDLLQREREEQANVRASRLEAIGRLAGGVAHDVNNLMTIVLGQTFVLRRGAPHGAEAAAAIDEIEETVERTKRLSGQLLAFSQAQSMAPTVVRLAAQVDATASLLRRVVEERTVIHVEHRAPDWRVALDVGQFEQVLLNLAVNARDAMPDGGHLHIVTDGMRLPPAEAERLSLAAGEYATIEMRDTGSGIAAESLREIFEPFFTTKGAKGTGLGLATVDAIMRKAGGQVTVESRVGEGTSFCLWLPRTQAAAAVPSQPPASVTAAPTAAKLIVCEDEPAIRRIVIRTLQSAGFVVHEAPTPADALAWLDGAGGDSDMLVSDIVMPGMSGVQLLQAARARKPELSVLLMTGYSDGVLDGLEESERPDGLLPKPFRGEELLAQVRQILAHPRRSA